MGINLIFNKLTNFFKDDFSRINYKKIQFKYRKEVNFYNSNLLIFKHSPKFKNVILKPIFNYLYYRDYLRSVLFYCILNEFDNLLIKILYYFLKYIFKENFEYIFNILINLKKEKRHNIFYKYNNYFPNFFILNLCCDRIIYIEKLYNDHNCILNELNRLKKIKIEEKFDLINKKINENKIKEK